MSTLGWLVPSALLLGSAALCFVAAYRSASDTGYSLFLVGWGLLICSGISLATAACGLLGQLL